MLQFTAEHLLVAITVPIYLFVIGLEIIVSQLHTYNWYQKKDTIQNFTLMLANAAIDVIFRAIYLIILSYCYEHRLLTVEHSWSYWIILLIAIDFMFYWMHRAEHEIRLLWAVHVTHHNSQHFNLTVGFRSSVFQPLYRFIFFIPLAFLGANPMDIILVYAATQIWGVLLHTQSINKLGVFEYFLVTPSHHRVHHASNVQYLDRNMGMLLIVWDKLFGTFQPEIAAKQYQPIKYGLTTNMPLNSPKDVVMHEWKAIGQDIKKPIHWLDKLRYLFMPPGWSHDGSRLTSNELRKQEAGELVQHTNNPQQTSAVVK